MRQSKVGWGLPFFHHPRSASRYTARCGPNLLRTSTVLSSRMAKYGETRSRILGLRGEIESRPDPGGAELPGAAELRIALGKADREVDCPRPGDPVHVPDVGLPVFREDMVQELPVIGKVKCIRHFMQVAEEISDHKPAPGDLFRVLPCDPDRGGRTVDARDLKAEAGK